MLTVLNDDSIAHPALECVFTTDEETGLVGAETLDKSQISARTMINLDSEEEGVATVSCAGGVVVTYTCPIVREHKTGSTSHSTSPACWAVTPAAISTWSAATATSSCPHHRPPDGRWRARHRQL